jgi:cytoskeletal protein RodZ
MAGELATLLRQKREEQGLSPQQVYSQTRIPEPYLHILEGQGDPRVLADTLYLVPFLRTYSAFLGLDPAETVTRFLADIQKNTSVEGTPRRAHRPFVRPVVIGLVLLALVVLGGYFFRDSLPWLESLGNSPGSR